jgi:hypothetical protein
MGLILGDRPKLIEGGLGLEIEVSLT